MFATDLDDVPGQRRRAAPFLLIALIAIAFGFVGLNAGGYSVDELFTLFVIDHGGGISEVIRRALTDTHPPAYYLLAYGWIQTVGSSETALRLFSALCAAGAVVVLFLGLKPTFTLPARAFAAAVGATSSFWFEFAQMARSYTLCALLTAALIALAFSAYRASAARRPVPVGVYVGLAAVSLLACFTHFYSFLTVGIVYLALMLRVPEPRFRTFLFLAGISLFCLEALYAHALLGATAQDVQNMWFSNAPAALAGQTASALGKTLSGLTLPALIVLALTLVMRPRPGVLTGAAASASRGPDNFAPFLCGLAVALVILAGLAVSFAIAPSFGKRNLLILAPFLWTLGAWLYDKAAVGRGGRGGAILTGLLIVACGWNLVLLPSRFVSRTEAWRESAQAIDAIPACRDAEIPVVLPYLFGPPTPFFRRLAQRDFFGRYMSRPDRLHAWLPSELAGPAANPTALRMIAAAARPGACPVLLWAAHDLTPPQIASLSRGLSAQPALAGVIVRTVTFRHYRPGWLGAPAPRPSAWILLAAPSTQSSHSQAKP